MKVPLKSLIFLSFDKCSRCQWNASISYFGSLNMRDATEGATGIFNLFILISFFWGKINKDVTKVAGRSSSRLPFLIKLSWSF